MPFDPEGLPDEVFWELSDPDLDYNSIEESAFHSKIEGVYENVWGHRQNYDKNGEKLQSIDTLYHEKLKNHQQKLAKESREILPSKAKVVWWLYAESNKKYKTPTKNSGKWLCFIDKQYIDDAWRQIKDATERGLLGGKSKVSTLRGLRGEEHVICIYTYDWKDEADVMRVREALRDLGFEKPIPYKTDADTLSGKYSNKGYKNISKYFV